VAYEVFTGTVPFDHGDMMQLLMMHVTRPPPPPREINPTIPEALERIILRLIEKAPEDRVQSCGELGELLSAIKPAG
jgi:serine/threonine-protein kinase